MRIRARTAADGLTTYLSQPPPKNRHGRRIIVKMSDGPLISPKPLRQSPISLLMNCNNMPYLTCAAVKTMQLFNYFVRTKPVEMFRLFGYVHKRGFLTKNKWLNSFGSFSVESQKKDPIVMKATIRT